MTTWEERIERAAKLKEQAEDNLKRFQALLLLTGFKEKRVHQLVNGYYGWWDDTYLPWYLFETDVGLIKIGWRKHVINIDWESTGVHWERPVDKDVTYGENFTHAWGYDKALEYLKLLYPVLKQHKEENDG